MGIDGSSVIAVRDLAKTFQIGFFRKRVDAVRGISFEVRPGETHGLIGPNGAGKTTTIKMLLRLVVPTSGSISIFGHPPGHREAARRLGYLPENPYLYQHLKPVEFLDLCGRLVGLSAADRKRRSDAMIERVGLATAADRPIGRFSKGMMQRVGLAQALLHDPELLILDEPMSGLDPIGRKEVRDLLVEERSKGKTLLFTTHILSDVEMLCERVTILNLGQVRASGAIGELLHRESRRSEIDLEGVSETLAEELAQIGKLRHTSDRAKVLLVVEGDEAVNRVLKRALENGCRVVSVIPARETLEALFVREAVPVAQE